MTLLPTPASRVVIRNLWIRYALAIGLIVALLLGSHWAQYGFAAAGARDAEVINTSGRQRTLSQQMLYFATMYYNTGEERDRRALMRIAGQFERAHLHLSGADDLSDGIRSLYFAQSDIPSLDQEVREFVDDARRVANQRSHPALLHMQGIGGDTLLVRLNEVVQAYESEARQRAEDLAVLERNALFLALGLLFLECVLIFVPAQQRANRALRELEHTAGELSKALERAEAASRARETFLVKVSHELRTPLNGVLGIAQALRKSGLQPKQQKWLGIVEESSNDLAEKIDAVMRFSALQSGDVPVHREPFLVVDMLSQLSTQFAPQAALKGMALSVVVDAGLDVQRLGDSRAIAEILGELVSNAIKFSSDGEVGVSAALVADDPGIVEFVVCDTGPGMSNAVFEQAQEAFAQPGRDQMTSLGGLGLGLPIVKAGVALLGGTVCLDRALGDAGDAGDDDVPEPHGGGARVIVRLPVPLADAGFKAA